MVRPMKTTDAGGVYRTSSEALPATAEEREEIRGRSAEEIGRRKDRYLHFLDHDPQGAWVAADGERVVGVALALVREGVWILSLFAVEEEYRDAGVGKELLDHALGYAEGCKGAMLASASPAYAAPCGFSCTGGDGNDGGGGQNGGGGVQRHCSVSAGSTVKLPPCKGVTARNARSSKVTIRRVRYRRASTISETSARPSSRSR